MRFILGIQSIQHWPGVIAILEPCENLDVFLTVHHELTIY